MIFSKDLTGFTVEREREGDRGRESAGRNTAENKVKRKNERLNKRRKQRKMLLRQNSVYLYTKDESDQAGER